MTEIAIAKQGRELPREEGRTVARCNHSANSMSVAEIEAMRAEPISKADFADAMTLVCERFDRELSEPLLRQFYTTLSDNMGAEEFRAAYRDFWTTEMFFANVLPFFVNHVKKQRENGPDLMIRAMSEAYRRGAE